MPETVRWRERWGEVKSVRCIASKTYPLPQPSATAGAKFDKSYTALTDYNCLPMSKDTRPLLPAFRPSGFFAGRTPLLPIEELSAWNAGLEAADPALDPAALPAAWARDRARLRARLRELLTRPEIREALFVASPSLAEGLTFWQQDPDSKKGQRAEEALVRYFLRMVTRPTPFGLFSGCSLGTLGDSDRFELAPRTHYQRHTRLDMDYLSALVEDLGRDPEIRSRLRYFPNSSLYTAAGRWRYAEARLRNKVRSHHLVAVEVSDYLAATLQRAQGGATLAQLAQALVDDDPEVTLEEAREFVGELVDSQLLVSRLGVNVSGDEPIATLIALLDDLGAVSVSAQLSAARAALAELDRAGLGNPAERYRVIAHELGALPTPVELPRLFQVDMIKPVAAATLGPAVIAEIRRGLELLYRLAGRASREGLLQRFCQDFVARYEDLRAVPLTEALDDEVGVGFDRARGAEASPLLEGLDLTPPAPEPTLPWSESMRWLLHRVDQTLRSHATQLEISASDLENELQKVDRADLLPLPDAFHVMVTLAAPDAAAVARGDFQLLLRHASGPSGTRLLGRFCHADPALAARVEEHLRAEEALDPEAIFAEIIHLPEGRLGNILFRPLLRSYEIPYLGLGGAPAEQQLPLDDLLVVVSGQRIELRSQRLNRRIIPRLTSAHNFMGRSLGLYRFLCALQGQGVREGLSWNWGPCEQLAFLPRVTSGRLVLCRARWLVRANEIAELTRNSGAERYLQVRAWCARRGLPHQVVLVESDNELLVDFRNALNVEAFLGAIKQRQQVILTEVFPPPEQLLAVGPEGHFEHEILIPFVSERPPTAARPLPQLAPAVRRSFALGSEWLYAKLYTGTATADFVLREVVAPVVEQAQAQGAIDRWFFIRYGDPHWHLRWRLHGAPQRLHAEVLPQIAQAVAPLLDDGRIFRWQLDTYDREIERYGGDFGVELAEQLFAVDSAAVLAVVAALEGDAGADARWRLALFGTDRLLDDLGFDAATKLRVLEHLMASFAQEFRGSQGLKAQLAARLRQERRELEHLLTQAPDALEHPLAPGFAIFARRSQQLQPIVAEFRTREARGQLTLPLTDLAPSFAHMFNNRLLRAEGRSHERVIYDFLYHLNRSRTLRHNKSDMSD